MLQRLKVDFSGIDKQALRQLLPIDCVAVQADTRSAGETIARVLRISRPSERPPDASADVFGLKDQNATFR